jgi:hypothetical protein
VYRPIPAISLAAFTALHASAYDVNAVSPEAQVVRNHAWRVLESLEQSQALFGAKTEALSQLRALIAEEAKVDAASALIAEDFIRALPDEIPLPEFGVDPDGSISLDWMPSRSRIFSLSVGSNSRLAYAWLDGTDKGHAVARFDGQTVPDRVLKGIISIIG